MFRRRKSQSLSVRLRGLIWPAMGVRRVVRYQWLRLQRLPASPTSIAGGFAIGTAMGFSPIVGTHVILAAAIAWLLGLNVVAAAAGTFIVNPWTGPAAWLATYYAGRLMNGEAVWGSENAPAFASMFKGLTESVVSRDLDMFVASVWPVLQPMLLGSIPVGLAAGAVAYFGLRAALSRLSSKHEAP